MHAQKALSLTGLPAHGAAAAFAKGCRSKWIRSHDVIVLLLLLLVCMLCRHMADCGAVNVMTPTQQGWQTFPCMNPCAGCSGCGWQPEHVLCRDSGMPSWFDWKWQHAQLATGKGLPRTNSRMCKLLCNATITLHTATWLHDKFQTIAACACQAGIPFHDSTQARLWNSLFRALQRIIISAAHSWKHGIQVGGVAAPQQQEGQKGNVKPLTRPS